MIIDIIGSHYEKSGLMRTL